MRLLPALICVACTGGTVEPTDLPAQPTDVRFATFNVSLHRTAQGRLIRDLSDPNHEQARLLATALQEIRPDVVLLNEVDWDEDGEAIRLLRTNFLEVGQDGRAPLLYPHSLVPTTNTGLASGVDLDGDGRAVTQPGTTAYGNDSFGFGEYPGQYGFAVLSRFPIAADQVRTFQTMLWRDMPGNKIPPDHFSDEALAVFRLSSKNHVDVPVQVGETTIHLLASHPTPPSFDGPEDKNGRRNSDEIAFWASYIEGGSDSWHTDDAGTPGGIAGAPFVIMGDLNADPSDNDATDNAIVSLLAHPRVHDTQPMSLGGPEQAQLQGQANDAHKGDPALDTSDFNDNVGNLRVDYALPSTDLQVQGSGVFWPQASDPLFPLVGVFPFPLSDHRAVWVDVRIP